MDIYFFIDMVLGVDGDIIKSELEKLADDISIDVMRFDELNLNWGFGRTSKATYERLFNAQLEYRADAVQSIYGSSYGYIETKPAQIPAQFHGKIKSIELDLEAYAVD